MKIAAIVAAAGKGKRFGSIRNKILEKIDQKPILYYSLHALDEPDLINLIVVALNKEDIFCFKKEIIQKNKFKTPIAFVEGGTERYYSVKKALNVIKNDFDYILIHDGARPFLTRRMIETCLKYAKKHGAACLGSKITSTIKAVDDKGIIYKTVSRNNLFEAQTPQIFKASVIKQAYLKTRYSKAITDDSSIIERRGCKVALAPTSELNMKITFPDDIRIAEDIFKKQKCRSKK